MTDSVKYLLFSFVLASLVIVACQREHNNIFDPKSGIDSLDLNLKITRSDSLVALQWQGPQVVSFSGFDVFRKSQDESVFSIIKTLPADARQYIDPHTQFEKNYAYYITVLGDGVESPPSNSIQTTPGADQFWVLDYWNFYILNITFDLRHIIRQHFAVWRPQAMSIDQDYQNALVTYPGYGFFEVFNPQDNAYIMGSDQLARPYDCIYEPSANRFWISDSSGSIYTLSIPDFSLALVSGDLNQPTYLQRGEPGQLFVLDGWPGRLNVLDYNSGILTPIDVLGDSIKSFSYDPIQKQVLAVNKKQLFVYGLLDTLPHPLYSDSALSRVRISPKDGSIWLAVNSKNSAKLVQLSDQGQRLNSLNGFDRIVDFNISSVTGYIVVADMNFNTSVGTVRHIRPDGTVIGTSLEAFYPYRVYFR